MRKATLIPLLFALHIYASFGKDIVSHRVKVHENLFRISLIYNSTVDDIVNINPGIKPDKVRIGMMVKVPIDTKIRDAAFVATFFKSGNAPVLHQASEKKAVPVSPVSPPADNKDEHAAEPQRARKSIEEQELQSTLENNVTIRQSVSKNDPMDLTAEEQPCDGPAPVPATSDYMSNIDLMKVAAGNLDVAQADLNCLETNAAINSEKPIDASQILIINLQIVMKDGSTRTISSPDEQRKILAQIVAKPNN
jgi:hypothetical protein